VRQSFAAQGVPTTNEPMAIGDSDIVVLMVADDLQVQEAVFGPRGLLAGIDPQRPPMIAVMSTVLPATVQGLSQRLKATGARVIDAPVSGGPARAEKGALAIMVGGAEADYQAALPVLQTMGDRLFHCGELGAGSLTKLINNVLGVSNLYLAAEAYALALKLGGDLAKMMPVLDAGTARNFTSTSLTEAQKQFGSFLDPPRGFYSVMEITRKDLQLIARLAQGTGIEMPVLEGVATGHAKMFGKETGDAVFQQWQSIAGLD
jgi:3-hydroxyisobutyrate dehydrogenase